MPTTKAPTPLNRNEKAMLTKILKKARAFKAYYNSPKSGNGAGGAQPPAVSKSRRRSRARRSTVGLAKP